MSKENIIRGSRTMKSRTDSAMIKNERQYKITKSRMQEFEKTLADVERKPERDKDLHPKLKQAQMGTVKTVLADLRAEVEEYERLRAGHFDASQLYQIESVPVVLIKARIVAGMTQKDLAKRLKVKEPQVQQYEASNYVRASLTRVEQVASILRKAHEKVGRRERRA
jgi:ribosome-binding protein aMBF1 (putative translation factor)